MITSDDSAFVSDDSAFVCPSCGNEADFLVEGYCKICCEAHQAYLDEHNIAFDMWESMPLSHRESAIADAIRMAVP